MFAVLKNGAMSYGNDEGIHLKTREYIVEYCNQLENNISTGSYIFEGISESYCAIDAEEINERLINLRCKVLALSQIFVYELLYVCRIIDVISLVSSRYLEEREDENPEYHEIPLEELSERLSTRLLTFSGKLYTKLSNLRNHLGLDIILLNKAKKNIRDVSNHNVIECINIIIDRINNNDWETIIKDFEQLCMLCRDSWQVMTLLTFADLYRLIGSEFEQLQINPDMSVFANHGRPFPGVGFTITV